MKLRLLLSDPSGQSLKFRASETVRMFDQRAIEQQIYPSKGLSPYEIASIRDFAQDSPQHMKHSHETRRRKKRFGVHKALFQASMKQGFTT